ncbi:hypothetical protein [Humidisolicoccus flavus]|uniref:hypothetical protein n=1 Tax=Humidisolicoccus flavus TaxID=3111414 RepID=UPI0032563474
MNTASQPIAPEPETLRAMPPMTAMPSVHIRAVLTWLAIFPLVSIGMLALAPLWADWHPVVRAFALTLIVVPLAVYLVVPQLLKGYARTQRRVRRGQ